MATGRCNDLKRRCSHYSRKESRHYKNCYRDQGLGRIHDHRYLEEREGRQSTSNSRKFGTGIKNCRQENGFLCRNTHKERSHVSGARGSADPFDLSFEGSETAKFEDMAGPLKKKRKFSPIVWDRNDKEVRFTSKYGVFATFTSVCSPRSVVGDLDEVSNVSSDEENNGSAITIDEFHGLQVFSVQHMGTNVSKGRHVLEPLADSHASFLSDQLKTEDCAVEQVEEEEYIETRSIAASRWASGFDFEDNGDLSNKSKLLHAVSSSTVIDAGMSSPESGELRGEGAGGSRKILSVSEKAAHLMRSASGEECYENGLDDDDNMEIDGKFNEIAGVDELHSDLDEDDNSYRIREPGVSNQRSINMLNCCRSVFEFEKLNRINEGTYGIVFKAKDKQTGDMVALKKVKMGKETDGFPVSSLREINILMSFHHRSIVDVKEVVMDEHDGVFMVMEYMEHDLRGLLEYMDYPFSQSEVKCLMLQLLEGVKYLHDNWVLHRDLKTSNLLLNNRGELKICDFGLSRQYGSPLKAYTPLVVTLYYRAPELLLGTQKYSTAIDMWSVGCIMAELLMKDILFKGENSEVQQLDEIFKTLGTPNETIWPGFSNLPGARPNFVKHPGEKLHKKFRTATFTASPILTELGFDLLSKLLTYDPEKRITAEAALNHGWFREVPLPKSREFMPTFPAQHERTCKLK